MDGTKYAVDYAKRSTSACKKCKQKLEKGELRLAKLVPNPFSETGGEMKQYFHRDCLFETFSRARATTKVIETPEDLEDWADLQPADKEEMLEKIDELMKKRGGGGAAAGGGGKKKTPSKTRTRSKSKSPPPKTTKSPKRKSPSPKPGTSSSSKKQLSSSKAAVSPKKLTKITKRLQDKAESSDDDKSSMEEDDEKAEQQFEEVNDGWSEFCALCDSVAAVSAYTQKTGAVKMFMEKRQKEEAFTAKGLTLLMKLLLPGVVKRVYNLNSKQLIKYYADIFRADQDEMTDHLNNCGDVSETISEYFTNNKRVKPLNESKLTIGEIDDWLEELTRYTKEEEQTNHLLQITKRCTPDDLKYIIREIKHDLRINAGAKHILDAVDPDAYTAFQASRDLERVMTRVLENRGGPAGLKKALSVGVQLFIPVLPMLAEACKSIEYALKKCPNGILAEIKYDGERVQVHKAGTRFKYFSRSLKPVLHHKVQFLEEFIPKAFPGHDENLDIILDSEILLVDHNGKPLPFGTLGKHKKAAFKDANVALFVFDCLMFDGVSLMNETLEKRKKILQEHMKEIPSRVMFSEAEFIPKGDPQKALPRLLNRCFNEGLEGLMLKDIKSKYEPGKRHWLKVKKDYLNEGSMADSADLIVLGAYYGTGNKGGLMSVLLMGCYDPKSKRFCTVTKCGNGLDDAELERVNKEMKGNVVKINRDYEKLPGWLNCSRQLVPDFVVKNPKDAPVWEISGAEFSKSEVHTAAGISIRFPRVTKIRDDKDWSQATNLDELKALYAKSKERADFGVADEQDEEEEELGKGEDDESKKAPPIAHAQLNKLLVKWEGAHTATKNEDPGESSSTGNSPRKNLSVAPKKRKSDETTSSNTESEPSPKKKKGAVVVAEKMEKKKKCQYGEKCFRKNPEHKKQFWHPGDDKSSLDDEQDEDETMEVDKDAFLDGYVIYLSGDCEKRSDLRRYVAYFGGEVTEAVETADYILTEDGSQEMADLLSSEEYKNRVLDAKWAWNCFKKKTLLPVDEYVLPLKKRASNN